MNGGKLVQNVYGHAIYGTHGICDPTGERYFEITSTHHQMQYPYNLNEEDYTLLFKSSGTLSGTYQGGGIDEDNIIVYGEPEIVYYHVSGKPECLAIQGHPEMMRSNAPIISELNNIIDNLLSNLEKEKSFHSKPKCRRTKKLALQSSTELEEVIDGDKADVGFAPNGVIHWVKFVENDEDMLI